MQKKIEQPIDVRKAVINPAMHDEMSSGHQGIQDALELMEKARPHLLFFCILSVGAGLYMHFISVLFLECL
jgi:hypothetical protein